MGKGRQGAGFPDWGDVRTSSDAAGDLLGVMAAEATPTKVGQEDMFDLMEQGVGGCALNTLKCEPFGPLVDLPCFPALPVRGYQTVPPACARLRLLPLTSFPCVCSLQCGEPRRSSHAVLRQARQARLG